jgi:hypothetical protein
MHPVNYLLTKSTATTGAFRRAARPVSASGRRWAASRRATCACSDRAANAPQEAKAGRSPERTDPPLL